MSGGLDDGDLDSSDIPVRNGTRSSDRGARLLARYSVPLTASIAVAAAIYLAGIWLADGPAVVGHLSRLPIGMVALALALPTIGFLVRFVRWDIFLRSLGHDLRPLNHLRVYMAGFALTTTPGKVGENLRAMYLTAFGVPASDSVAAFVVERLGDVIAMLALCTLVLGLLEGYGWAVGLAVGLTVLVLAGLRHPALARAIRARGSGQGLSARWASSLARALESAGGLLSTRLLFGGVAVAVVAWSMEAITFSLLARQMGMEIPFLVGMGIFAVATLLGAVSFLPGGVGPTEAIMVGMLVVVGGSVAAATAVTLVIRVFTLWWAVLLGVVALLTLGQPGPAK